MALNFKDIASKKFEEVEKPPLPPVGTYRFRIIKLPAVNETDDWDILNINCCAVEALDDADLSDYAGEVTSIFSQVSFIFNKNDDAEFGKTEYNARNFFEKHVKCAEPSDTFGQAMNACVNQEFLGTIGWRPDKRNEGEFQAQITRTAPVE